MNITIKYRPFQDFGDQRLRDTYRRVPCGDHQYVRFLEGLGAPRQQALRLCPLNEPVSNDHFRR